MVLALVTAALAEAAEPRSALLIYADPRLSPAIVGIDEALRATVDAADPTVRFYTEYLDVAWFPQGREGHLQQSMRAKYAGRTFDVVVPCGEAALRFALRERATLFPGVPMVFCTVEDEALAGLTLPPDVTGVTIFRDWVAGVELIRRLHPGTRRIVLVTGASPVERGWEAVARRAFARDEGRLAFTYLTGLPIEETVRAIAVLPADAVVVFNILLRDGAGRAFTSPDALARLAPAARVPIYGYAETHLGHGIVGGPLVAYRAQAVRAGELVVRVLRGERLGPADVVRRVPYQYTFDARQLARWRIPERLLPPGSVVRFRTPSPWSEYAGYVLGAVAFIGAQMLLIVGLLAERRRRRRVQEGLDERLRFEILLADLAAAFVAIPAREIEARLEEGLGRIVAELGVDRAGLAELAPGGGQLRVKHHRHRDGVPSARSAFLIRDWPWTLDRLQQGQIVSIERLADLPAEAATDRASFEALGTRSIVMLPLVVGGVVLGGFACSMQRERQWPPELVKRLSLLADIFALVLLRQRADRALQESEGRFRQMADAAPVLMWIADADGGCVDLNRAWLEFTGRPLAAQVGDQWWQGVHPDDREACRAAYRAAVAARRPFTLEYRLRRADGTHRAVLDSAVPTVDAEGDVCGWVGAAMDVTDVKAGQQALVQSLELRSAIFGSLYGELAVVDRTGRIIAANESWTRLMEQAGGDARTAGIGANYLDVCRRAAGDPHARAALEAIEAVLAGRSERQMLEYPCVLPTGVQWYAMIVEPLRQPGGGAVISHVDITRRRRAEEEVEREREDLAHALRVSTLGELATTLAHEINQPLAAISANAQAARNLLRTTPDTGEVRAVLEEIAADAQRAARVIRRLRALFRKEHGDRRPVDTTTVIREVVGLLSADLQRRRITLDLRLPDEVPRVLGDVVQLQQVLLNVVLNAAEAMTDDDGPRSLEIGARTPEAGLVTITVRDCGPGVADVDLERIFGRFVTTKAGGLGMGLSISRSIVQAHGGRMWATANTDRGLTVHIELPCLEEPLGPGRPGSGAWSGPEDL